jgi:uncharacterized protein (TIGR03435 family)
MVVLSCVAPGQSDAPAFQSADLHVSKGRTSDRYGFIDTGRAEFRDSTMVRIIAVAYGVEEDRVVGGPKWIDSTRFDLNARAHPTTPYDTVRTMLRALLEERMKLAVHTEDRPMQAYVMSSGKGGFKLKDAAGEGPPDCEPANGSPPLLAVACKNMSAAAIAENLRQMAGNYLNHPVFDATGLKGTYDFTVSWTGRGQLRKPSDPDYDPAKHISFFDAAEKQLGLKFELQTRPMPVIIVDKIEESPAEGTERPAPPAPTEFEVASLRPSKPGGGDPDGRFLPSGQIELANMPLKDMIMEAFAVRPDTLIGAPKWMESDRYDVHAKTGQAVPIENLQIMFQKFLIERFGLKVHREEQPINVYALTGKGTKLKAAAEGERQGCKRAVVDSGLVSYTCQATPLAQLAEDIPRVAPAWVRDHPVVVDATGLTGTYDFVLSWSPRGRFGGTGGDVGIATDPTGDITLFEAVDKQLGLKLSVQRKPIPVLVIDKVNRTPTEN